jgi:hypothetical protein
LPKVSPLVDYEVIILVYNLQVAGFAPFLLRSELKFSILIDPAGATVFDTWL